MQANSSEFPVLRVYAGADIHNRVDPFATAMIVDGESIAWLGSDEAVRAIASVPPEELPGQLISPPFVNAWAEAGPGEEDAAIAAAKHSGIEAMTLVHAHPEAGSRADGGPVRIRPGVRLRAADVLDAEGAWRTPLEAGEVLAVIDPDADRPELDALLTASGERGTALAFEARADQGLEAVLAAGEAVEARRPGSVQARGHRLRAHIPLGARAERLAALGIAVTIDPLAGRHDFAEAVAAGAVMSLGWDPRVNPWEALRAVVFPSEGVRGASARSAFTAATKGGWRALEGAGGAGIHGVLAPGAPASFAVWRADGLVVQAADGRLAAWSTDPRAGTPGLPDLSPGTVPPVLQQFVILGRNVIDVV